MILASIKTTNPFECHNGCMFVHVVRRAKSMNKGGGGGDAKGGNVCSECKKTTDRLSYCFHCASAVCEDCRSQHTEGVVKDLERQSNTLQGKLQISSTSALILQIQIRFCGCH